MKTFAVLFNPMDNNHLENFWPISKMVPRLFLRFLGNHCSAFKTQVMRSKRGKETFGYFLPLPVMQRHSLNHDGLLAHEVVRSAAELTEKLQVDILGVCADEGVSYEKTGLLSRQLDLAITNGCTFTAWAVFETLYRTAKQKNIDLKNIVLAVIGADSTVGSLSAQKFAESAGSIWLYGGQPQKLQAIRDKIAQRNPACGVSIESGLDRIFKESDIIINIFNNAGILLSTDEVKENAIVCDVSLKRELAERIGERRDVTVIKGNLIRLPFNTNFSAKLGLPDNIVYACIAEAMLLALEEKIVNYSLEEDINIDKLEEIANIAARHGFEVCVP
ncbi:MAG: hypothetical protein C4540_07030 [Candidatus Omnitrophota bacterium]|jgi:predicted amino acid dehydrogenase|nr:MAG: hypothetical protein C4540_07030 [Candidatus Omnitrophota bacterium]